MPKIKLDIVVEASIAPQVVSIISKMAKIGKIGDRKIFVMSVKEATRIRTGETGRDAL